MKTKWGEFKCGSVNTPYSLDVWHGCLQSLRHYLRGWSLRISGENKETKKNIAIRIEEIGIIAEKRLLSNSEWEERINLEETLDKMNLIEELQWKQKVELTGSCKGMQIPSFSTSLLMGGGERKQLPFLKMVMRKLGAKMLSLHTLWTTTRVSLGMMSPVACL